MSKKKKIQKTKKRQSLPLKSKILRVFRRNSDKAFSHKKIASILNVNTTKTNMLIGEILSFLVSEKVLKVCENGFYALMSSNLDLSKISSEKKESKQRRADDSSKKEAVPNKNKDEAQPLKKQNSKTFKKGTVGLISLTQRGVGYVSIEGVSKDIYIHNGKTGQALNGDLVELKLKRFKGKDEGQVLKVIERAKEVFVGTIEGTGSKLYCLPDDHKIHKDFVIPSKYSLGAKQGQKVVLKLLSWPEKSANPIGKVIDVLGKAGENHAEMHSILAGNGLPYEFPQTVIKESERIAQKDYSSVKGRRDMRETLTFTIDPADAKDFDDALSFKKLENGNIEVGVHIADVSYFVKYGTAIDEEAYSRGNSVYLVDRVVPMLPEVLSNELCSLRPHEDKLTFSAVFELDESAHIVKEWFGRTLTHSDERYAYEQAQEIIEGKDDAKCGEAIQCLNHLAKKMREKRLETGALNIESEEVRFQLDEKGLPVGLTLKISKDANKLIEEFMLLANKRVATFMGKTEKENSFVYRIHAEPNPEKIADLEIFLKQFGYEIQRVEKKPLASALNDILAKAKEKNELHIIGPMVIRSMSNALYDVNNIGHYGLAFENYTHFTSPIRRYADLLVHRMLSAKLEEKVYKGLSVLSSQCQHISATEKSAAKAERESTKLMQVKFMSDKLDRVYDGLISGVKEWGFYVELTETKCEGLVHVTSLKGAFHFNSNSKKLESKKPKKSFHLGQKVTVKVKTVNEEKRQIDLVLVEN